MYALYSPQFPVPVEPKEAKFSSFSLSPQEPFSQHYFAVSETYFFSRLLTSLVLTRVYQKTLAPWEKSYDKPRQCFKKQRHYFAHKGPYTPGFVFYSSHVGM